MRVLLVAMVGFLALLSFSSCQKEYPITLAELDSTINIDTAKTGDSSFRVKAYGEVLKVAGYYDSTVYALTYDSQGRLLSLVSKANPGNKIVYQYNSSTRFSVETFEEGVLSIHVDYLVNSFSRVDSSHQYNNTGDTSSEKYLYDSSHQLLQLTQYDIVQGVSTVRNVTSYEYDANGNTVKETGKDGVTSTDYYLDKQNTIDNGVIYFQMNKNLEKSTTKTNNGFTETLSYAYTFDNLNRITSITITSAIEGTVRQIFTY